ncbi:FadR/GntR family transcriptional regulator [Bifidobacterium cuniculi]|uniref:Transcriptional regulator, GntR family n=1 Tax=Bifidobacterium cuniculi TaxID=1688 RepID=A0A087B3E3_9BIFI|nr:GntR family transcriptional regulator [Bifidobacterium cuniculi]KFI65543.1 transcriptional regulator, GntR family [Bifidobacterium cuniculi]
MQVGTFDDIRTRIASFAAVVPPSASSGAVARPAVLQTPSRCEAAMDAIKSYIIRKGLRPGDPLPNEATLCEELGVSRSSVREAVRKLEALHIVSVVHGKGMFVGDLSLEPLVETLSFRAMTGGMAEMGELRDVIQVRRILDLGVSEQVVDAMRGTEQPRLLELAEQMAMNAAMHETFLEADIEFHAIMHRASGNVVLSQLADSLWLVHMAILPQIGLSVSEDLMQSAESHRVMVEAAMAGDLERYRQVVIDHYRPIEGIVETYLKEHGALE